MSRDFLDAASTQVNTNARQINTVLLLSAAATLIVYLFLAAQTGAWQIYVTTTILTILIASFLIARRWLNSGRAVAATTLAIYSTIIGVFINALLLTGLGLAFAVGLLVMVSQAGSLVFSNKETTRALVITAVASLGMIVLDILNPPFRAAIPLLTAVIPVTALLLTAVLGYLIFRSFSNYTLRGKLTVAMLAVAIMAVVIISSSIIFISRSVLLRNVGATLQTNAAFESLAVGEVLARQVGLLESLALNEQIGETATLTRFQNQFPSHVTIFVTDETGTVIAATDPDAPSGYGSESWWLSVRAGEVFIGDFTLQEETGVPAIAIAVPIPAADGDVRGVLYSQYQLDLLAPVLTAVQSGETTGKIEIHLGNGRKVSLLPDGRFQLAQAGADEINALARLDQTAAPFVSMPYNGESTLFSQARVRSLVTQPAVDALDWRIVFSVSTAEALLTTQTQQQILVLLGAIVIVLAAAAAALVSQRMAKPIVQLTAVAQNVREGDLSARAQAETEDEIGLLADTFNEMTERLALTLQGLEARVAERTRALEISAQVSRRLSTILDQDALVKEVVEQVQSAFSYYHVHIYLWDEASGRLQLAGGTGRAAQQMMAAGHAILPGKGLVGRAARSNLPVLVADVTKAADWLPNELLPDTKAEAAVPIALGGEVVGVLDVQQNRVNGLTQQDVELLQSVANQVAIGLQNARLYAAIQQQAAQESAINQIAEKIRQTTDVESALQVAVRELGRALHAEKTVVRLTTSTAENGRNGDSA